MSKILNLKRYDQQERVSSFHLFRLFWFSIHQSEARHLAEARSKLISIVATPVIEHADRLSLLCGRAQFAAPFRVPGSKIATVKETSNTVFDNFHL